MTALPFGAMPEDTGEFMLGDVHVTVVLMESNNSIDNGTITYSAATNPPRGPSEEIEYTPENWTLAAKEAVKQNILEGLNWWKDTLDALPNVRDGLLNFTFDWTRWAEEGKLQSGTTIGGHRRYRESEISRLAQGLGLEESLAN